MTGTPCGGSATAADVLALRSTSPPLQRFAEEILVHLGGSWDQPPVLDPGWERDPGLDPLRTRAATLLDDVFGASKSSTRAAGWEDPRLALLLPFWLTVTSIDTTIVVVRDPAEVAASLLGRYGIDPPRAALLWLRYVLAATASDRNAVLVNYGDLVADPRATVAALAPRLDGVVSDRIEPSAPALADDLSSSPVVGSPCDIDNPLVALATTVWNAGTIDLGAVPPIVADLIRRGHFRPPVDGELLARARAQVMQLRERVRRRHREAVAHASTDGRER